MFPESPRDVVLQFAAGQVTEDGLQPLEDADVVLPLGLRPTLLRVRVAELNLKGKQEDGPSIKGRGYTPGAKVEHSTI